MTIERCAAPTLLFYGLERDRRSPPRSRSVLLALLDASDLVGDLPPGSHQA